MSHYLSVVIYPKGTTWRQACNQLPDRIAAHAEWYTEEDDGGVWDWYQIGGRWTGYYSKYDPTADPRNSSDGKPIEEAEKIPGIGKAIPRNLKWPTDWVEFEGDLVPVAWILNLNKIPYTVFPLDGTVVGGNWEGDENGIRLCLEANREMLALVVDYHS